MYFKNPTCNVQQMFIFHCNIYKSSQKRQKIVFDFVLTKILNIELLLTLCVAVGSGQGSN